MKIKDKKIILSLVIFFFCLFTVSKVSAAVTPPAGSCAVNSGKCVISEKCLGVVTGVTNSECADTENCCEYSTDDTNIPDGGYCNTHSNCQSKYCQASGIAGGVCATAPLTTCTTAGAACVDYSGKDGTCQIYGKAGLACMPTATPPAGTPPAPPAGSSDGWSINSITGYGLPQSSVAGIISGILSWLLLVFGFFGIIGFIIAGIIYLMSTGDEDMIEWAKGAMKWSVVGVAVGLLGMVIMKAVNAILSETPNF